MESNSYFVYILTNKNKTVLYIGVTNDIERRLDEHRNSKASFTSRYGVHRLVYVEETSDIDVAILREKDLKGFSRERKEILIEMRNPMWNDLSDGWAA